MLYSICVAKYGKINEIRLHANTRIKEIFEAFIFHFATISCRYKI